MLNSKKKKIRFSNLVHYGQWSQEAEEDPWTYKHQLNLNILCEHGLVHMVRNQNLTEHSMFWPEVYLYDCPVLLSAPFPCTKLDLSSIGINLTKEWGYAILRNHVYVFSGKRELAKSLITWNNNLFSLDSGVINAKTRQGLLTRSPITI